MLESEKSPETNSRFFGGRAGSVKIPSKLWKHQISSPAKNVRIHQNAETPMKGVINQGSLYETNPNNALLEGNSLKIIMHLHQF